MIGRSMIPVLTRRGALVLASGAAFVAVGALRGVPPIIALGGVVLSALLTAYLWFFPVAILLRRKKIELSWWVPPGDQPGGALAVDRPFALHLAFRNHGVRTLRILHVQILGTRALVLPTDVEATTKPGRQVEVVGEALAQAPGYHVLHGSVLVFGDILGLLDIRAYFPNPLAIKVFPRQFAMGANSLAPQGRSRHEHVGLHHVRRRGLAGELRELREYAPGDSFKYIAWKATARQRKLMVRDIETEIVVTHQILVDIGGSMRQGAPGATKLDYAIETAAALARSALGSGDRVGLLTYGGRVHSELKPGNGHHHFLQLVDRLIETLSPVDEDLTDLTSGELIATVARYLAYQEAVDARIRQAPPLEDPAWANLQAGPSGELYDVRMLDKAIETLLEAMGEMRAHKKSAPTWWWTQATGGAETDPRLARMRLFCRLRGIELPFRYDPESGRQASGLVAAIDRVVAGEHTDVLVLVSDLLGLAGREDVLGRALMRARRRGRRVVVIAPFGPAFAPAATTPQGRAVAEVLTDDERLVFASAQRMLVRHGVPVLEVGPDDAPSALATKLARMRAAMRRAA
ncbi:DUF58 domain-containing protein [Haliangium ochraceum]|uniref:DUF58 domain-containing protein n=1 Tax=Haliangium ochraceum (strain DSM 14365 / JCM 11303 / SMP-2) TaxID=502025 RepID=D0LJ64_HALO1|nr:DUF58 domain-containing protein [Haliangium ochraceum]ACY14911.1 protein of unknown function DUF58 [Haliangium ochraceum DSM 14365]